MHVRRSQSAYRLYTTGEASSLIKEGGVDFNVDDEHGSRTGMAQHVGWGKFVWRELKLVAFRCFDAGDVRLLDVLVRESSHGLTRIGTLFDLGAPPDPATATSDAASHQEDPDSEDEEVDVSKLLSELKEEAKKFERSRGARAKPRLRHFTRTHLGDWRMNLESSDAVVSHISGLAGASILGEKGHSCLIEGSQSEEVNVDHVAKLLSATPPGWLPNRETIRRRREKTSSSQELELWVVTKIVYARRVVMGKLGSGAVKVDVSPPLGSLPITGGVGAQRKVVTGFEVVNESGAQLGLGVPIGYQAIRVKYEKGGDVRLRMGMGKTRPVHRGAGDDRSVGKELEGESGRDYHMADLLDDTLQSLPVVSWETRQDSTAGESQTSDHFTPAEGKN